MRLRLALAALALSAGAAQAQPAQAPTPAPEPPTCTTTTVVVKRGDVVLSSSSTTHCDEPGARPASDVSAALKAPGALLTSVLSSGPPTMTFRKARGDWRVVEPGAARVCHMFLATQPTSGGYAARASGCGPFLSAARSWTFADGVVSLHDASGAVITRLTGYQDRMQSDEVEGRRLVFDR
jgi:hypothetical protein